MVANIFHALYTNDGQAQFWGAFFAALFSLITLAIVGSVRSYFSRKAKHYNGLVVLSTKLNRHIARIYDLVYTLEGFLKTHESGGISLNDPTALKIEPIGDYSAFLDVDLINDLFSYDHGIERLNDDVAIIGSSYSQLRSSHFKHELSAAEFSSVLHNLPQDMRFLIRSWKKQIDEGIDISVQVRLMMVRDRGVLIRLKQWMLSRSMKPLTLKDIKVEKAKLMVEIEQVRKGSRKEIEELSSDDPEVDKVTKK